jgi:hypothetical protein
MIRARSLVVGAMAASAMVIGGAGSASANVAWCMSDPPAKAVTQDGANLSVNVYVAVPRPEVKLLNDVSSNASTAPDGTGGTLITVRVSLPVGMSNARITASVNRYQVTATVAAAGGTVVTLYLDVPRS